MGLTRRQLFDAADLAQPDHLPTCGRCGDLGEVGQERCEGCGNRFYPRAVSPPQRIVQPKVNEPEVRTRYEVGESGLTEEQWAHNFIYWCPTCQCDTTAMDDGTCGFCDTVLTVPFTDDVPDAHGVCQYDKCGNVFEVGSGTDKLKRYCSEKHRKAAWFESPAGRDWRDEQHRRRTEKLRKRRAEWYAQGLNSRGEPYKEAA